MKDMKHIYRFKCHGCGNKWTGINEIEICSICETENKKIGTTNN